MGFVKNALENVSIYEHLLTASIRLLKCGKYRRQMCAI